MKKNSSYLLAVLFLTVSCSKSPGPVSLISKWQTNADSVPVVQRKLASGPEGQCLKDIFGVDLLRAEVKELERQYASAQKVTGTWKHLNLASLPVPQANFLKTHGANIGDLANPESIDYSSCQDVPCIFNKIYGRSDSVAGYVHYIWYLKFGNMLSADNMVPGQVSKNPGVFNGKSIELSSYLYDDKELYGFWRLSQMLKTPHTTLGYLKEVQRVPRGEAYEQPDYKGACGLASSAGTITLTDGCLSISANKDNGYLYPAVTHELSHHVDFEQGRGTRAFYRSHKDDYLVHAGMYLEEYVDKDNKQVRQWKIRPNTKLMTSYAGTAPQENFAESLSYFRIDGDMAKRQITEEHFKFVSKDYYQDRSFEKEALLKSYLLNYSAETSKQVFKAVVDCSKDPGTEKSAYFGAKDFSYPVLNSMLSCLGVRATEISQLLKAKIAISEADGCNALNEFPGKTKWEGIVQEHLKAAFDQYLQELNNDKDYLARIQAFYDQLADKAIARDAYVNCYGENREELCYQEEVKKLALSKAQELKLPVEQTLEMAQMYASYHSFQSVEEETKKQYQTFVKANLELIRNHGDGLWESCGKISHNDDERPTGNHFQLGDGYMISSYYNCLNAQLPDTLKETVRSFSIDGATLQHPKEELILSREVKPHLINILKAHYIEEKEKEIAHGVEFIAEDKGELRKQILSNFTWVKNVVDNKQILSDCKLEAYRLIPFETLFNLKKDLFSEYVGGNTCVNIPDTSEFSRWLEGSKGEMSDKVTTGLEAKMIEVASIKARECVKKYPMTSALAKIRFKRDREACLIDPWPGLENSVLQTVSQDPIAVKFQISPEVLRGKLEGNRRVLQIRIIKEFFN